MEGEIRFEKGKYPFIDVDKMNKDRPFRVTINFNNLSEIKHLLPHIKDAKFSSYMISVLLKYRLSTLTETLALLEEQKMHLPIRCTQHLRLLFTFKNYESGISNAYEKAELIYKHLKKAVDNGATLRPDKFLPPVESFSKERRNVELSFKIMELFNVSTDQYRYMGVLYESKTRDPELTKLINGFLDSKRNREDIITRPRANGRDLDIPESDSESESTSDREVGEASGSSWKKINKTRPPTEGTRQREGGYKPRYNQHKDRPTTHKVFPKRKFTPKEPAQELDE